MNGSITERVAALMVRADNAADDIRDLRDQIAKLTDAQNQHRERQSWMMGAIAVLGALAGLLGPYLGSLIKLLH